MTKREFHKYVYTVEVLSEVPLHAESLGDISYLITEGDCSGVFDRKSYKTINGKQAAKALIAQGSDPEFFQIDENGNDVE